MNVLPLLHLFCFFGGASGLIGLRVPLIVRRETDQKKPYLDVWPPRLRDGSPSSLGVTLYLRA